jgi:DNA-binding NtrC family response regulator
MYNISPFALKAKEYNKEGINLNMQASILIVDKERNICSSLIHLLTEDYTVYEAFSCAEAIDIVKKNSHIDVILYALREVDTCGIQMIEKIRTNNKDIYIIVIAPLSDPYIVCEAMKKGANNFLLKPINISELESFIKNAIRNKSEVPARNALQGVF